MKKWFFKIIPSEEWHFTAIVTLGIVFGLGFYIFYISKAWSYLSDRPETCVNCHVMATEYVTWFHSSHKRGVCNDCHVPHQNFLVRYLFKAKDGLRHATIFTLRLEPQTIKMNEAGVEVVGENCLRCHKAVFGRLFQNAKQTQEIKSRDCWNCHRETPHGRVKSLSSVPNARVPLPESPVPEWLSHLLKN
ncbi:MAG TPA: cytochrome c nitrite reductase small subunit [Bacteroidales bacterium]|nr:cytochrome c nitrite reductase small subunit [Bacteroidales bacterium]